MVFERFSVYMDELLKILFSKVQIKMEKTESIQRVKGEYFKKNKKGATGGSSRVSRRDPNRSTQQSLAKREVKHKQKKDLAVSLRKIQGGERSRQCLRRQGSTNARAIHQLCLSYMDLRKGAPAISSYTGS